MSENEKVITYDYKTVNVKREMEFMLTDAYEALGWELVCSAMSDSSLLYVSLSFKRNRKIKNKIELHKLQSKIDSTLQKIGVLQTKKSMAGMTPALSIGIGGALVFGGGLSMALLLSGIGGLVGGIILCVAGAAVATTAYPFYKKLSKKQLEKIEPMLETELDNLSDYCEQAANLQ